MIAAIALLAGVIAGLILRPTVPTWLEPYLPIAVVAALDAVFGGIRARLDNVFDAKVFVVSFVSNVLVAALIVYLGDKLGDPQTGVPCLTPPPTPHPSPHPSPKRSRPGDARSG
jgi:small basic protein